MGAEAVSREINIRCDECDEFGDGDTSYKGLVKKVRAYLRSIGWVSRPGCDLCPKCRPQKKGSK